ncbi:AEC family transporter [Infirmifilum lucidum]|uniref:AEC family transporter n=1 Tax=Infirmifilum lucidum TaxID=2776706 RepID=A0A7L9FID6_9CREN|nr:AEC family transporter [Infirmifilum lucidum]QOJ79519.1 AEC family transporter [Infirmifilum lucidum]
MFEILAEIYIPIAIGLLLGAYLKPGERELAFFSRVVLYVFLPALLFLSTYNRLLKVSEPRLLNLSALSALGVLLTFALTRSLREDREIVLTSMYANAGYVPVGIAHALWGEEGVSSVGFYILGNNSLSNSIAPLLSGRGRTALSLVRRILLFPPVTAVILGASSGIARLPLPDPVLPTLKSLSDAAATVALLQLGLEFGQRPGFDVEGLRAYLYRLAIVIPLTVLFVKTGLLGGVDRGVAILESVMPSAVSCVPISRELGFDSGRVARIVFTSTLVSTLVALPAVLFLLKP